MKRLKLFSFLFVLKVLLVFPALPILAETTVSSRVQIEDRKADSKIQSASVWNRKGIELYKKKEYTTAAECFKKAIELNPLKVVYITNLAIAYSDAGKFEEALKQLNKALEKFPQKEYRKNFKIELADLHGKWALSLYKKYDYANAIKHFEMAYVIDKNFRPKKAAGDLHNIGRVYSVLGQSQKALKYYEKALSIKKEVGDRAGEATTLNNIGRVYSVLGQSQKALEYYEKALSIEKEVGDRTGEATTLNNIGLVYEALGQSQKALGFFKKALPIDKEGGDRTGEATTLNNIGAVYDALGQKQKALEFYQKALPIQRTVENRAGESATLNNIGAVYFAFGQKQKALEFYQKALSIIQAVGYRVGEARTLNNIGAVYDALGQKQKALEFYQKALPILQAVGDHAMVGTTLNNLMGCWESLKNTHFSIFYGKQSVNTYQNLRANISKLNKDIKRSYLETKKDTYRYLATLLIDAGRIPEAQNVVDMLKEEEFFQFIRRDRSYTSPPYNQLDFNEFEKKWLEKYKKVTKNLSRITGEYYLLKNKKFKNDYEKKQLEELESNLEQSRKAYHEYLTQLKKAFAEHDEKIKEGKYQALTLVEHAKALQSTLRELDRMEGGKNVMLHYLFYKGKVTVILTTPHSQLVKSSEIDEKKLNRMIIIYREVVRKLKSQGGTTKTSNANAIQKDLYDVVFKPIDEELKKYGATNLMIFLDGVLRYISLPALCYSNRS